MASGFLMTLATKLPTTANEVRSHTESTQGKTAKPQRNAAVRHQPIWNDYFARTGQSDSTTWQYHGYWSDTARVWFAYYSFAFRHPIMAFIGCRQFFQNLIYRVFGATIGDRCALPISLLTPLLAIFAPIIGLMAVAIAKIPKLRRLTPPLFQPFTLMGWSNYCTMLFLIFIWHGYRQKKANLHPLQCLKHSSKLFWNEFFSQHLPQHHNPTKVLSVYKHGRFSSPLPKQNIIIKPESGGAGYKLRSLTWDPAGEVYRCTDIEKKTSEPSIFTPHELALHIKSHAIDFVIERWERARAPLPTSSLRILTINLSGTPELLSAAFLPAPEGSISTAYFDLDAYLINFADQCVGQPIRHGSNGCFTGTKLHELAEVTEACLNMHALLPGHIEISWDVMLTANGPVYLEGNVFPPGCDYKLSIFKTDSNLAYMKNRMLDSND
jgi:hypothetical protein